jgi:hypothetical protein
MSNICGDFAKSYSQSHLQRKASDITNATFKNYHFSKRINVKYLLLSGGDEEDDDVDYVDVEGVDVRL